MKHNIDIIYNMTTVCPHDCAVCCVDATHVVCQCDVIRVKTDGLMHEWRLTRNPKKNIYDQAANYLQDLGLELNLRDKLALIEHIDILPSSIDLSGGDPLCITENIEVLKAANKHLGRENVTLTATGTGLAQLDISKIAQLIGELNFTFDCMSPDNVVHRPKKYANQNLTVARIFANEGCITRAEFPVSRPTSSPEHLQRLYAALHEAGISKLHLMRMFPVGRGVHITHDILNPEEYRKVIVYLRELERIYQSPQLYLQCALRQLEQEINSTSTIKNPCDLVHKSFGLMPNGNLLSSPWAIDSKGRSLDEFFILGNLAKEPLSTILDNPRVLEIRARADENFGHCKVFSFIHSLQKSPIERLLDKSDPILIKAPLASE